MGKTWIKQRQSLVEHEWTWSHIKINQNIRNVNFTIFNFTRHFCVFLSPFRQILEVFFRRRIAWKSYQRWLCHPHIAGHGWPRRSNQTWSCQLLYTRLDAWSIPILGKRGSFVPTYAWRILKSSINSEKVQVELITTHEPCSNQQPGHTTCVILKVAFYWLMSCI